MEAMKMSSKSPMNRRHCPRKAFSGPVLVDFETDWTNAVAMDVSAGGVKIRSERPLPVDRSIEIYFELDGAGIEAQAHVVHQQGQVYGLAFERDRKISSPPYRYSFRPAA